MYQLYEMSSRGERIGRLMAEMLYIRRTKREIALLTKSATERYKLLLKQHPNLVQEISVKHLASYLGIQPESLSRIRKKIY